MGNKGIIVILVPLDDGVGLIRMGDYGLLSPVSSLLVQGCGGEHLSVKLTSLTWCYSDSLMPA